MDGDDLLDHTEEPIVPPEHFTPDHARQVQEEILRRVREIADQNRRAWGVQIAGMCVAAITVPYGLYSNSLGTVIAGGSIGLALAAFAQMSLGQRVEFIAQIRDPAALGALLDLAFESGGEVSDAAWRALDRVLPLAQRGHAHLLSDANKDRVVRLLHSNSMPLLEATIGAIQRMELIEALPVLEHMARSDNPQSNVLRAPTNPVAMVSPIELWASWPQIRYLADDAVDVLRPIAEAAKAGATLLRPADPSSENLVRAASFAPDADPQSLLRPTADEA
jgi:hypothetical protein